MIIDAVSAERPDSQGIPSCVVSSGPLAYTHKLLGLTGVDVLLGTTAYAAYQMGTFFLSVIQQKLRDVPADGAQTGRINFIDSGYGTPSCGSQSDGTMRTPPWRHQSSGSQAARVSEGSSLLPSPVTKRTDHTASTASTIRRSRIRGAGISGLVTTAVWLASTLKTGELESLSASLSEQTPSGIAMVLPPIKIGESHPSVDGLIHEAQKVGNSANLLVFPETALVAKTEFERYDAIDRMVEEVCKQYGVYVQLGVDSYQGSWCEEDGVKVKREGRINEVVLISPNGEVGCYSKQKLIPCECMLIHNKGRCPADVADVESYPFSPGLLKVPTWSLYLSA
jgi:hypothetical protein